MVWLLMSIGCVVGGGESVWEFEQASAVTVLIGSGEVSVRSVDDDVARLWWEGGGMGDNARPDVFMDDAGRVTFDANGGIMGGGDVRLGLPAGVAVEALVERGEIDVGLREPSDVSACVAAGEVSLGVPAGAYQVDIGIGAGSVDNEIIDDPTAPYRLHACVGAGDVSVFVYDELLDDGFWGDHPHDDW